jgi:hypothetical protein
MENPLPFYWTKVIDIGVSHPVIARIASGISELMDLWQVSKDKKKAKVNDFCSDLAKDLIEAEKQAMPVIREIETIEINLNNTANHKTKFNRISTE